ncbi:hypothetical protein Taro_019007, partial [Colocasia esculenta]|nr:hypothetical protein [Colocasia esculenta]
MLQSGTPPLLPFFFFPLAALLCSPSGRKSFSSSSPIHLEKSHPPPLLEYEDHGRSVSTRRQTVSTPLATGFRTCSGRDSECRHI